MFLRSEFASLLEDCKRIDSYKLAAIEPNKAANMSKFRSNPHTTSSKLFNKCVTVISYDSSKNIYWVTDQIKSQIGTQSLVQQSVSVGNGWYLINTIQYKQAKMICIYSTDTMLIVNIVSISLGSVPGLLLFPVSSISTSRPQHLCWLLSV